MPLDILLALQILSRAKKIGSNGAYTLPALHTYDTLLSLHDLIVNSDDGRDRFVWAFDFEDV